MIERFSSRVVLEQSASLIGGFTGTVDMAIFDSISVDIVVGTATKFNRFTAGRAHEY